MKHATRFTRLVPLLTLLAASPALAGDANSRDVELRAGRRGTIEAEHVTGHDLEARAGDGKTTHELAAGKFMDGTGFGLASDSMTRFHTICSLLRL